MPSEDPRNQPPGGAAEPASTSSGETGVTLVPAPPAATDQASTPPGPLAPPPIPRGEVRYRVQLIATLRAAAVYELQAELRDLVDAPVYAELEQGLWKLRVGDFTSRDDADGMRRRLVGIGFSDAFVVEFRGR
jgi:cell division septation protein DedD